LTEDNEENEGFSGKKTAGDLVLGAWGGARPGHSKRNFVSFCLIHLEIFNSTSTGVRMTNFQDANFDDFTSHRRVKRSLKI
jgi:hypothetical protein